MSCMSLPHLHPSQDTHTHTLAHTQTLFVTFPCPFKISPFHNYYGTRAKRSCLFCKSCSWHSDHCCTCRISIFSICSSFTTHLMWFTLLNKTYKTWSCPSEVLFKNNIYIYTKSYIHVMYFFSLSQRKFVICLLHAITLCSAFKLIHSSVYWS